MTLNGKIRVLMIEATSQCNANCTYCPRGAGVLPTKPVEIISMETLERALHLAKFGDNTGLYLHHRGDPFLHPDLSEIISRVRAEKFFAYTSTNIIAVSEIRVREVLKAGINELQLHLTGGLTRKPLDVLLERVHMIRRLNWELRNNACKVEINYALVNESEADARKVLSASPWYDETFNIYFYKPHPWPRIGDGVDRGVDPSKCNWYKERSCAVLANGDVVICCLDQWGRSSTVNIWEIEKLAWPQLSKRDLCRSCTQHVEMDWLRRDAIEKPDWLIRRLSFDPFQR